jgi:hypothetical protein
MGRMILFSHHPAPEAAKVLNGIFYPRQRNLNAFVCSGITNNYILFAHGMLYYACRMRVPQTS